MSAKRTAKARRHARTAVTSPTRPGGAQLLPRLRDRARPRRSRGTRRGGGRGPPRAGDRRAVPPHRARRRGRHGRGLQGRARPDGQGARAEDPARRLRARAGRRSSGSGRRRRSSRASPTLTPSRSSTSARSVARTASISRWSTCRAGTSLRCCARCGALPEPRAIEMGQQILGSLAEAHDAGVVHRDMKPANVMLMQTRPGEDFVKVLDFGIAKLRDEGPGTTTTARARLSARRATSRRSRRAATPWTARADLYAVGCLLYELVAGRPPFVAPSPMAVVAAHLHQAPPPLAGLAPGTSRALGGDRPPRAAEAPRRPLPDGRRDARRAARRSTEPARPAPRRPRRQITGELEIARREDFRDFDRQVRAPPRPRCRAARRVAPPRGRRGRGCGAGRTSTPSSRRAPPRSPQALPPSLRPSDRFDGVGARAERRRRPGANTLPLPPGQDGAPAGGVAVVRGFVGAKLSDTTGDVDVYRLEMPPIEGRKVLVAEWRGVRAGEGIRGLDVTLSLNRERGPAEGRTSAPLVASVDRGGAGPPRAARRRRQPGRVLPHGPRAARRGDRPGGEADRPVLLEVRLGDPRSGRGDRAGRRARRGRRRARSGTRSGARSPRRNPLAEGAARRGDDRDRTIRTPRGPRGRAGGRRRRWCSCPPGARARRAALDAGRRGPRAAAARGPGALRRRPGRRAGDVLSGRLAAAPREGAPALVQIRAADGEGRYLLLALGPGSASGAVVQELIRALVDAGRLTSGARARGWLRAPVPPRRRGARCWCSRAGSRRRRRRGSRPDEVSRFDRAARALGAAMFEVAEGAVRYGAAFEARVTAATATPRWRRSGRAARGAVLAGGGRGAGRGVGRSVPGRRARRGGAALARARARGGARPRGREGRGAEGPGDRRLGADREGARRRRGEGRARAAAGEGRPRGTAGARLPGSRRGARWPVKRRRAGSAEPALRGPAMGERATRPAPPRPSPWPCRPPRSGASPAPRSRPSS